MKILRLRLTNLNSLRGANEVDFTRPPLADAGLFAITGRTGAGKTTLLDAITLALYGRVARYGKDPSPDAVMSRHTGDCSAEVEFACTSGTFRSVWQLQRARKKPDGKLQPPKRRLISLPTEEIMAESIKDCDTRLLELTGLDYDRFVRSVLLAQGEFAAFLKAGAKERTDLLQEVTGTALYQDISQAAFRRSTDAQQSYENLLRDHQAVSVLSPEARRQEEISQSESEQRRVELQGKLQALLTRINNAQRWLELDKSSQLLANDQAAFARAHEEFEPALTRLLAHERAVPAIAKLATSAQLSADLKSEEARLKEINTVLPDLIGQVQAAEEERQKSEIAIHDEEKGQETLRSLWTEVIALDHALFATRGSEREFAEQHMVAEKERDRLIALHRTEAEFHVKLSSDLEKEESWLRANGVDAEIIPKLPEIQSTMARWTGAENSASEIRKELESLRKEIAQFDQLVEIARGKLPPCETQVVQKRATIKEVEDLLAQASQNLSSAEIAERHETARTKRRQLEELRTDAARILAHSTRLAVKRTEAEKNQSAAEIAARASAVLFEKCEAASQVVEARRKTHAFAERIQSLETHRAALQKGEPCPLCGAKEHPFATSSPLGAAEAGTTREELKAAEKNLKTLQTELGEAEKIHAARAADRLRIGNEITLLNTELEALVATWKTAALPLNLSDQYTDSLPIENAISSLRTEESHLSQQANSVVAAEKKLHAARFAYQEVQATLDRERGALEKHQALAAQISARMPALETSLRQTQASAEKEIHALTALISTFSPLATDLASANDALAALKIRAATFDQHRTNAQTFRTDLSKQAMKVESLGQQVLNAVAAANATSSKLSAAKENLFRQESLRRDKFGARSVADAQQEAATKLKKLRETLELSRKTETARRTALAEKTHEKTNLTSTTGKRRDELQAIEAGLHEFTTKVGFGSLAELRQALLSAEETGALVAQRRSLEERRISLGSREAALRNQRSSLPATAQADADQLAVLETEKTSFETDRTALDRALGERLAILKNDDAQRLRQAAFAEQIDAAHREYKRWDKLRALIGSADGSLFARFAQGLTLERLTVLANHHLAQLNPRYSMRRAPDDAAGDLELEIVDHYQAETARPMRSLSGGESFLASLALALGLSELASGRTSIDSLFIDEGFGALDGETLEIAMAALENLQARGKTIGIISHVPAMQERISTQIQVIKEAGGCSRIAVTG